MNERRTTAWGITFCPQNQLLKVGKINETVGTARFGGRPCLYLWLRRRPSLLAEFGQRAVSASTRRVGYRVYGGDERTWPRKTAA